jgi:type II secretory pathway pseudopilin PulG
MLAKRFSRRDDEGVALVMVIGVSMVLTLLAAAGVAYAVGSTRKARNDQDWNGALAAAYAAVEEYQSRLANDPAYLSFGNPAAPFSTSTGSTVILPETTGGNVNPAFSLTGWATVPGSTAQFRYEVDNSDYYTNGTLRLRATGKVGEEVRSLVADLRQKGFIDFLYFTDFETQDPDVSRQTDDSTAECSVYEYHGRSSDCTIIQFGGFDVIDGPLHTNDTMQLCSTPDFLGMTTSTYQPTSGLRYKRPGNCAASPFFAVNGTQPAWQGLMPMPDTNSELRRETRTDLPVEVPNPGCLYTGPTSIVLDASGKMRVRSPWTKVTSPNGAVHTECGTPGSSGLGSATGQLIDVPLNTVIYVQNVPSVSGDPNFWTSSETKPTCATNGNSLGYPLADESVRYTNAYGCRNGDVFINGTLDGHVTIAAENYIYITEDIIYENSNEDILGLVGQNAVWVWNPYRNVTGWTSFSGTTLLPGSNRRIDAAILSVAHTFMVQNYDVRNSSGTSGRGTLTINGAIAQKFRGTVATSSSGSIVSGYAKDYNYDIRFRTTAPPKFLAPAVVTYGVTTWIEVAPAFHPDGTPA